MSADLMRHPLVWLAGVVAGTAIGLAGPTAAPLLDHDTAIHVANRLTFGATTATVDRISATGLAAWLDAQLHPAGVPDPRLDSRLAGLPTLVLPPRALAETYNEAIRDRRAAQARMVTPPGETTSADAPLRPAPAPSRARPRDGVASGLARQALVELTTQKLVRATTAERQLEEVLVDFWFNHFNVFAGKGPVRQYVYDFEQRAIRPHVFGSFRTMLGAVAASPAMLFYLDNWQSSAPEAATPTRRPRGLNENYARELLELHTLGVDGGYTQQDIGEVARAFTGWTIRGPREGGEATFDGRRHVRGVKVVLGQTIPAHGGRDDGERVLDIVARHPATARHVATKLAARFVSDTPPASLVARVAARFTQTDGDLRATMAALVQSPEFVAREARFSKVKTPLEFVASAVRVLGADVEKAGALGDQLRRLGMPPYFALPPTGYSTRSDAWTNGGALVQRMNVAVALTHGRIRGVGPAVLPAIEDADGKAKALALSRLLLLRDPSAATLAIVARASTTQEMAALIIGSPEFQRR
jgi:uncharacterized protein (DUF1800 family)